MKTSYTIRPADPTEAKTLTQLALLSKGYWGYPQAWLDAWHSELTVTPAMIKHGLSLVAELNGEIAGFWYSSLSDSPDPIPAMLFIHPHHMGKGLGRRLLEIVKAEAIKRGIKQFIVEADPNAVPFYLKMGAEKIGELNSTVISGRSIPLLRFTLLK